MPHPNKPIKDPDEVQFPEDFDPNALGPFREIVDDWEINSLTDAARRLGLSVITRDVPIGETLRLGELGEWYVAMTPPSIEGEPYWVVRRTICPSRDKDCGPSHVRHERKPSKLGPTHFHCFGHQVVPFKACSNGGTIFGLVRLEQAAK